MSCLQTIGLRSPGGTLQASTRQILLGEGRQPDSDAVNFHPCPVPQLPEVLGSTAV